MVLHDPPDGSQSSADVIERLQGHLSALSLLLLARDTAESPGGAQVAGTAAREAIAAARAELAALDARLAGEMPSGGDAVPYLAAPPGIPAEPGDPGPERGPGLVTEDPPLWSIRARYPWATIDRNPDGSITTRHGDGEPLHAPHTMDMWQQLAVIEAAWQQ